MPSRKVLDRSFKWIREHPGATNLDVPDDLLADWTFNDDDDEQKPSGFFLSVFTLGFLQAKILSEDLPVGQKASIPVMAMQPKLAYSLKELAAELGVSKVTIYRLETRQLLRSLPHLRTKIYSRQEVERFLNGRR